MNQRKFKINTGGSEDKNKEKKCYGLRIQLGSGDMYVSTSTTSSTHAAVDAGFRFRDIS